MKGTLMDITYKESMLRKLQESEEINKKAQSITHIGNWIWEIKENTIQWSDEMYTIYGMEPQSRQITFEYWFSFIYPEDREKRMQSIRDSLKTLHASDYLIHIDTPGGAVKVLQGREEIVTDKNNKPLRLIGTCQDVTHEHTLKEELQEKGTYLKELINNAPDSVIVIDGEGMITLCNPKTEEVFGWTA